MGYIKTRAHMENFIKKIVREAEELLDKDKLLSPSAYFDKIGPHRSDYTWALRYYPTLLHEDELNRWLDVKTNGA